MSFDLEPIVGNWYQHLDKGQKFEVVAVDEDSGLIEIQYFDGDLEEIDLDAWDDLEIEPIEPPEDWTGPLDEVDSEDLDYPDADMESDDWSRPLKGLQRQRETWEDAEEEEEWENRGYDDEEPWEEER